MTDANIICHDLDLLGDWLDAKGYTEEAGLCTRAMDEINRLREALKDADTAYSLDLIIALRAENARLKELLNDGHTSMIKENEQLKWTCAAKDADNTMMRSILKRLVRDARAAVGDTKC